MRGAWHSNPVALAKSGRVPIPIAIAAANPQRLTNKKDRDAVVHPSAERTRQRAQKRSLPIKQTLTIPRTTDSSIAGRHSVRPGENLFAGTELLANTKLRQDIQVVLRVLVPHIIQ